MRSYFVRYTAAVCLMIAACSPTSRSIPRYDDTEATKRVLSSLSPWNDGGPDQSDDGRTPGDRDADRQTYMRWHLRYAEHEMYRQHDRDYVPFEVPGTIGEAIAAQRAYERLQKDRADQAKAEDEQAIAEADVRAEAEAAEAERQADETRLAQEREAQAEEDAKRAADAADASRRAEATARSEADYACRNKREEAINQASGDKIDPQKAMAAVRTKMRCPLDNR